jgi:hypothetical protein
MRPLLAVSFANRSVRSSTSGSIAAEQPLEAGKLRLGEVAAEPVGEIRASSPDEQVTASGVAIDPGFAVAFAGPGDG